MSFLYQLGAKAKSSVSGVVGIITARCDRLHGPNRYEVTPVSLDGQPVDSQWMDEGEMSVEPTSEPAPIAEEKAPAATAS